MAPRIVHRLAVFAAGAAIATWLAGSSLAFQQAPSPSPADVVRDAANPAFEVVSIKPNSSGSRVSSLSIPPRGRVAVVNTTLEALVTHAYDLRRFELVGGPAWIGEDRFDVQATPPDGDYQALNAARMRTLLAERFRLRTHRATRDLPVYALVTQRGDRQLGPQLLRSEHDCAAFLAGGGNTRSDTAPRDRAGRSACATLSRIGVGRWTVMFGGSPLGELARKLEPYLDRRVIDDTGVPGLFDVELTFAWPPGVTAPAPDAPDIFTAVQEQLGLRLQPRTQPMEVLVIDAVEQPELD